MADIQSFPSQKCPPWSKINNLALKSLKKRAVRAAMTMLSVILSIAFLSYTWISNDCISGLRSLDDQMVNTMLLKNGIDLASIGTPAKTKWLIMLSLMVSSVGILNAMLTSVTERFKEIGTMKCIGATNSFIVRLFVVEAGIQGFFGTMLGIISGSLLALIQTVFTYGIITLTSFPIIGGIASTILALSIGMGLTIIFAIYPAYTAAHMLPVEAMRVEE